MKFASVDYYNNNVCLTIQPTTVLIYNYVHHCIQTQVYAQNEELQTQLEGSKRNENFLQEQINKAEQKLSDLHRSYDELQMLTSGEEMKTQLSVTQRKMQDVKNEFSSMDVIKMHYAEKVMILIFYWTNVCMYVAGCVLM